MTIGSHITTFAGLPVAEYPADLGKASRPAARGGWRTRTTTTPGSSWSGSKPSPRRTGPTRSPRSSSATGAALTTPPRRSAARRPAAAVHPAAGAVPR
ncbi:hypothetical protein ACFQZ4_08755 [Catellatospora coxensis]